MKKRKFLYVFFTLALFCLGLCSCKGKADTTSHSESQISTKDTTDFPETSTATEMTSEDVTTTEFKAEGIASIRIVTENSEEIVSDEKYVSSSISVFDETGNPELVSVSASVKVRGNSTAQMDKKPYRIKFDQKQSVLGLNSGNKYKSWVLLADYFDASMERNHTALKLAAELAGDEYYVSDSIPVMVFVNESCKGMYLLCEKTQINVGRVSITENNPEAPTLDTGYLLVGQGGRTDEENTILLTPQVTITDRTGESYYYDYLGFSLSGDGYTNEQIEYIASYVNLVFKVIYEAIYNDTYYSLSTDCTLSERSFDESLPDEQKAYETISDVFDLKAAERFCVLEEIVKDFDGHTFNMFVDLSAEGNHLLTLAAPWDYDFALGNTQYRSSHSATGYYATVLSETDGVRVNPFYVMLANEGWFNDEVSEIYENHHDAICRICDEILTDEEKYGKCYQMDWNIWGAASERKLLAHCRVDLLCAETHEESAEQLHSWLMKRISWLDSVWGDGTYTAPSDIVYDFTDEEAAKYISYAHNCTYSITGDGLFVTCESGEDPYLYIDYSDLTSGYTADDYTTLEIEMMIPAENAMDSYLGEIFLMSGYFTAPSEKSAFMFEQSDERDTYVTYTFSLDNLWYWYGDVYAIRLDYFSDLCAGDYIYIRSISLLCS